ncbi:MAG: hypothetical protein AABW72_03670 [archaeon]
MPVIHEGPVGINIDAKLIIKIMTVVFLASSLLFVLTWTNTFHCKSIPGWCDVYYSLKNAIFYGDLGIKSQPKVAIVYGEDGLGDPYALQTVISDIAKIKGQKPDMLNLKFLSLGNLKQYDLVIVDHARTISTEQISMFITYANQGGKLVWTGDAGTQLPKNENPEQYLLYMDETTKDQSAPHTAINPWARKLGTKMILLNELISVNYQGNYCNFKPCPLALNCDGKLVAINKKHPLVYGLSPILEFCFVGQNNFSLVSIIGKNPSTVVLSAEMGSNIFDESQNNYGNILPLIVLTSKSSILNMNIGENVAYYALPPEYYAYNLLDDKHKYYSLIENLYYGMLFG